MKTESKLKELFSNIMVFAISNIGTKIILFFMVPLYTNYLTTSQFGTAELVVTTTSLLIPLFTLAINESVYRFSMESDTDKKEILKCFYFVYFFSIILTVATTVILSFIPSLSEYRVYFALITLTAILNDGYALYIKGNDKNKIFAIDNIIYVVALALFNIVFLVTMGLETRGYLLAIIISKIISFVYLAAFGRECKYIFPRNIDKNLLRKMLQYSTPLLFNSINWWVIGSSDKYMLSIMISTTEVGLYTVAAKVPSLVNTATTVFTEAWTISSIKEYNGENDGIFHNSIFSAFNILMALLVSFVMLIARPFMHFYVSDSYFSAVSMLPTLLLSAYFLGYASFVGVTFSTVKKSSVIMKSSLIAAGINILANFVFIPLYGGQGAAIATMLTYAAIAAYRLKESQKYMPVNIKRSEVMLTIIILGAQAVFVSLGYYWSLSSIIALFLLIFIHRKNIVSMYSVGANFVKSKSKRRN